LEESFLRVYLDACALNRLTDDQSQARIRTESEAVQQVLSLILMGKVEWKASRTLEVELIQNPDLSKRTDSLDLLSYAGPLPKVSDQVLRRGRLLATAGYGAFDALHLAHAEETQVDALLTTDDRFVRQTIRGLGNPMIRVVNPVEWVREVRIWLQSKQ
jgi:predicted nucleic acid-binding protein